MIKHVLNNEIIKLNVKSFFVKPETNGSYEFLKVKFGPCFQKSF
jgi:hypothetical protein